MNKGIFRNEYLYIPVLLIVLIASVVLIAKSALLQQHPDKLSFAVTIDLVLTIPLLYLLLIRKKKIPNTTTVPLFILGIVIAGIVVPEGYQSLLDSIKHWVLPIVEVTVLGYVIYKVQGVIKRYRRLGKDVDFVSALRATLSNAVHSKIRTILITEIAVIYYVLNAKKKILKSNEFSYHKKSGTGILLGAFIFLILVETVAVHVFLQLWSDVAAWILTGLSLYTILQITGIMRSLSKRPIMLENGVLKLRYGILSETDIPLQDIERVELSGRNIDKEEGVIKLSPLKDFEKHNIIIYLKSTNIITGLYGSKKSYEAIALHIDEPKLFEAVIVE